MGFLFESACLQKGGADVFSFVFPSAGGPSTGPSSGPTRGQGAAGGAERGELQLGHQRLREGGAVADGAGAAPPGVVVER